MPNPFEKLTDEQLETRIRAVRARLSDMELQEITEGNTLPDDLPTPPPYELPGEDTLAEYRPKDWEI